MQHGVASDAHALAHHGERADGAVLADRGRRRDVGQRMDARAGPRRLIEQRQRAREIEVRILRRRGGRSASPAGAARPGWRRRLRVLHLVRVFGIGQKSELAGTGVLHAGDAGDLQFAVAGQLQPRAAAISLSFMTGNASLPNPAGIRADHRIAGLTRKCLLEFRHIREQSITRNSAGECGSVCACSRRASGVAVLAPDLGKSEEESLLRREAVHRLARRGLQRHRAPGGSRRYRPCSRPASAGRSAYVVDRREPASIRSPCIGALCSNSWRPPGSTSRADCPRASNLPALVVEPVRQLVADHGADAAVVHRVIALFDRRTAAAECRPGK